MLELEKTYLAKYLPDDLTNHSSREIIDVYWPLTAEHPTLRLRKNGVKHELTKKEPVTEGDSSIQIEQTIKITEAEFNELIKLPGKESSKIRYYYPYNDLTAEFTVFNKNLAGLVLIDFEFKTEAEKNAFVMPEFCLADMTQEEFLAGGMPCGKSYDDIEEKLKKFDYKKIEPRE